MKKTKIKGIKKLEKTDLQNTKAGLCGRVDGPTCLSSFTIVVIMDNAAEVVADHYGVIIG